MLVEAGWFRDLDDLMLDALRRFVESHPAELMERFMQEDVEWGLHDDD
jgi:DNA-binding transcriptional regulator YbjK